MDSGNDPSRRKTSILLEEPAKTNIKFVLVGGFAAVAQGVHVTTLDGDCHEQSPGR